MTLLQEIRWHGRGGQGSMTASDLIAKAAVFEGKFVQSFPEFGPERMGAPLRAFTRVSKRPIKLHCAIYKPDVVVVLDPTLLKTIVSVSFPRTSSISFKLRLKMLAINFNC